MRIVEPPKTSVQQHKTTKNKNSRKLILLVVLLFFSVMTVTLLSSNEVESPVTPQETTQVNGESTEVEEQPIDLVVSGNQLRIFYDQIRQVNTSSIPLPPPITRNEIADNRIIALAEMRGYRLRTESEISMPFYGGVRVQKSVINDWENMRQAAARDGVIMSITSGYRSIEQQRQLFLNRLLSQGATVRSIVEGKADSAVIEVLKTTALPGYSKHHSGYTIDLLCSGTAFDDFKESQCHTWLSANNYEQAFKYGFIPSYPEDADLQGPEPEAWEYVWVGVENLYF